MKTLTEEQDQPRTTKIILLNLKTQKNRPKRIKGVYSRSINKLKKWAYQQTN